MDVFEPNAGWAETAHLQPQTPRGYWQDHISRSERISDEPSEVHGVQLEGCPRGHWLPETHQWVVALPLPWHSSTVNSWQVWGMCLNLRTCLPLMKWHPRLGCSLGRIVSGHETPSSHSMAEPTCVHTLMYLRT